MRLAGNLPSELIEILVAANNEPSWPSIHRPVPVTPPEYRYDEHMKEYVPNIVPVKRV